MKTAIPKPSKQSIIREARDYVMIAIGMILYGIGWTVFLLPNDITTGGVPPVLPLAEKATPMPPPQKDAPMTHAIKGWSWRSPKPAVNF